MPQEIITVKNQYLTLKILPKLGASIYSLATHDKTPIQMLRPCHSQAITDPRESACFPLAPHAHRIGFGKFHWHDKNYRLSANMPPEPHHIHGEAWQSQDWQMIEQTETGIKLQLDYRGTDWPFKFTAIINYRLNHAQFYADITLINREDVAVPMGFGFHPYFTKTKYSKLKANVKNVMLVDDVMMPIKVVAEGNLLAAMQNGDVLSLDTDHCFSGWDRTCQIIEKNYALVMNADESLGCLQCYAPKQNFFCAEPVSHFPNALNVSRMLAPHEKMAVVAPKAEIFGFFTLDVKR